MFVPIEKHEAEYHFDTVKFVLDDHGINIASNMSEICSGANQELYALNYGLQRY
jgi:hypothetical protein